MSSRHKTASPSGCQLFCAYYSQILILYKYYRIVLSREFQERKLKLQGATWNSKNENMFLKRKTTMSLTAHQTQKGDGNSLDLDDGNNSDKINQKS